MSDLPGPMTKQILSAPPRIIRSTRYSLTAQGRSPIPSTRLPTGSSSFENPSGWIRVPRPAAGIMPSISGSFHQGRFLPSAVRHDRLELLGTPRRSVLGEHPLPGPTRDTAELAL